MTRVRAVLILASIVWGASAGGASAAAREAPSEARKTGGVKFAAGPKASRAGGKVKIAFTASAATDAEVAVLDAEGQVVRHLAAGMLGGGQPPPPPLAAGLSQEILWDGRDDAGKKAPSGGLRVRVRLGLQPRLERIVGWSGQSIDKPRGWVCGPDGTLYVVHGSSLTAHRQTTLITAHGADGRYLRQVFPGPAGLPPEKRRGWPRIKLDDGTELPVVFHLLSRSTYPGAVFAARIFPVATRDGRLILLSALHGGGIKHPDLRGGRRLLTVGTDGSVPENYLGPVVFPEDLDGFGHLALSPDEKTVYVAGLFQRGRGGKGLCQVVWRAPLDGSGKPEVFLGKLYAAGKGGSGLNDPQGLATDKAGNIYVADYGNDRVAAFKPDGSYLDEIPAKFPDQVRVSRKTGAVYVMCLQERKKPITDGHYFVSGHNWKMARVVKFGGLKDKAEKASMPRPQGGRYGGGALLALDESGEQPVLWVCDPNYGRRDLVKVIDRGDKLEAVGDPIRGGLKKDTAFCFINEVTAAGGRMICRDRGSSGWTSAHALVFEVNTGAPLGRWTPKSPKGRAENVYSVRCGVWATHPLGEHLCIDCSEQSGVLRRYKLSGEAAPFSSFGSHAMKTPPHAERHVQNTTCFLTREGTIYHSVRKAGKGQAGDETVLCVRVISPEGKVENEGLLEVQAARVGGLCLDSRGNVYLGAQVSPAGERIPPPFKGKLPGGSPRAVAAYSQYGAVLKFPPGGGKVTLDPQGKYVAHRQRSGKVSITGKLLARGGVLPGKYDRTGAGCSCETSRFDIDGFDRLFVPDPLRFSVKVLDTAGNEITRFGSYGNMDSRGPGSPVPKPEIAFGWPIAAECMGGRALVADLVNRRVSVVRFEHAAEAVCSVP